MLSAHDLKIVASRDMGHWWILPLVEWVIYTGVDVIQCNMNTYNLRTSIKDFNETTFSFRKRRSSRKYVCHHTHKLDIKTRLAVTRPEGTISTPNKLP